MTTPVLSVPRESLLHVMKGMPAAPQVLSRIGQMTRDPDVDLADFVELLRCDPALTARIIRIANSPYYCVGSEYSSIEQALARIGMSEIYTIAGFAAVVQMSKQNLRLYGITAAELRENSLLTALIMESLAKSSGVDPQEAYSAGLLRSMGKIALDGLVYTSGLMKANSGITLAGPRKDAGTNPCYDPTSCVPLSEWEAGVAGLSNCQAASFVLSEWRFPAGIVDAIGNQYAPSQSEDNPRLAALLNVSCAASVGLGFALAGEGPYWARVEEMREIACVSAEQVESASQTGLERFCTLHSAIS